MFSSGPHWLTFFYFCAVRCNEKLVVSRLPIPDFHMSTTTYIRITSPTKQWVERHFEEKAAFCGIFERTRRIRFNCSIKPSWILVHRIFNEMNWKKQIWWRQVSSTLMNTFRGGLRQGFKRGRVGAVLWYQGTQCAKLCQWIAKQIVIINNFYEVEHDSENYQSYGWVIYQSRRLRRIKQTEVLIILAIMGNRIQ